MLTDISILICTYNRAESLRLTLESARGLVIPANLTWELLIVDNNSTDPTEEVCNEFSSVLPIRYIQEKRQGLSPARNRGIEEARGSILAFTDDDVDVDPAWVRDLWRAAKAHPETGFFGGKIVPLWEEKPPAWIAEHSKRALSAMSLNFSLGEEEIFVESKDVFYGANMAFRREVVLKTGSFREDLGVTGTSRISHEETDYMWRLLKAGYRGLYVPGMVVYHRNPPHRMTEKYMLHWFSGFGVSRARLGYIPSSPFLLFGVPRYLWRQLATSAFFYLTRRWRPSAGTTWVPSAVSMATTWGAIRELRRMGAERGGKDKVSSD
jgi:GT2 family glycosyltransferase